MTELYSSLDQLIFTRPKSLATLIPPSLLLGRGHLQSLMSLIKVSHSDSLLCDQLTLGELDERIRSKRLEGLALRPGLRGLLGEEVGDGVHCQRVVMDISGEMLRKLVLVRIEVDSIRQFCQ